MRTHLSNLLARGPNQTTAFVPEPSLETLAETMVAFANADGGRLLFVGTKRQKRCGAVSPVRDQYVEGLGELAEERAGQPTLQPDREVDRRKGDGHGDDRPDQFAVLRKRLHLGCRP